MSKESEIKTQCGYVAFFDILGYREMTSRQDFSTVIKALREAEADALDLLSRKNIANCELFSFGDSMIVFCAGDFEDSTLDSALQLPIYCRLLFQRMFNRGMPVRGAIAKGEFYFKGNSYAGQPLNEAYEYANSLEFAGCVLTPSAEDLIAEELEVDSDSKVVRKEPDFREVSVPIKNQGHQKLYVLTTRMKPTRERVLKEGVRKLAATKHEFVGQLADFLFRSREGRGTPRQNRKPKFEQCWQASQMIRSHPFQTPASGNKSCARCFAPFANKHRPFLLISEHPLKAFQKHGKTVTPAVLPKLNNTVQILAQVYDPLKIPPRPKKISTV